VVLYTCIRWFQWRWCDIMSHHLHWNQRASIQYHWYTRSYIDSCTYSGIWLQLGNLIRLWHWHLTEAVNATTEFVRGQKPVSAENPGPIQASLTHKSYSRFDILPYTDIVSLSRTMEYCLLRFQKQFHFGLVVLPLCKLFMTYRPAVTCIIG